VTKTELEKKIAEEAGITAKQAAGALGAFRTAVEGALKDGREVRLPGFGRFYVAETKAREGRNPATGEPMQIPPGKAVRFKPAAKLKAAANRS